MRFSLATLVLLVLWIGAVIAVWIRRDSWVLSEERFINNPELHWKAGDSPRSPDNTRMICWPREWSPQQPRPMGIYENADSDFAKLLFPFKEVQFSLDDCGFLNDDTAFAVTGPMETRKMYVYRRRFPEWWWGHFYRPEVWLALGLSAVLIWRAVRAKKERGAMRPAPTTNQKLETTN